MLYLYGTSSCHLCEEASALLLPLHQELQFVWTQIDIADNEKLLQRFSLKIPVLYCPDNDAELCWPFAESDIREFLVSKIKKPAKAGF